MRVALCFVMLCIVGEEHFVNRANGYVTSYPVFTLSEMIADGDAMVLGAWVSAEKLPGDGNQVNPGRTTYRIMEILKDSKSLLTETREVVIEEHQSGNPGDQAILFGSLGTKLEWGTLIPVTKTSLDYIKSLPKRDVSPERRLEFFLSHLESADDAISADAYLELAYFPTATIKEASKKLPREKLRQWVTGKQISETRLSLYWQMLGFCGTPEDAKLMESLINQPAKDFRLGIDGVMAGYLLLKGEDGLELLEETKLKTDVKTPFSETYAAFQALRFAWHYSDNIKKDRLKQSMRLLLDRPELADLAIKDLARWKDWAVQDRVIALYDKKAFDDAAVKRAVVWYTLACSRDTSQNSEYAAKASDHLMTLRQKDPVTVEKVERFYKSLHGIP